MKGTLAETGALVWAALRCRPRLPLIIGAVAVGLAAWFLYVPGLGEMHRLSRRWGQIRQDRQELRQLLDRYYQSGAGSLPDPEDLSHLLERLHELARNRQVEILTMTQGGIRKEGSGGPASCEVELQLQGEFRALGIFFGALSGWERFGAVSVQRIQIKREEGLLPRLRASAAIEIRLRP